MNAFEQRRRDRTVPASAHGSYAFVGSTHRRLQDEPSAVEIADIVAEITGHAPAIPPRPYTVADLQRSISKGA